MATGYEKFDREDLKKAISYLKRKDPENESLQKYDDYFRSYTTASKKAAKGSVTLFDNALEKNIFGEEERKKDRSRFVRSEDGGWESKGYGKEMEKRKENPGEYSDSTIADKAQKELKKKFGLEGVDEFITYVEAQKMAKDRRENPEKYKPKSEKLLDKVKDSKAVDVAKNIFEFIDRPGDAIRTGVQNKLQGESFVEGLKEGWSDDEYTTDGKELNRTIGFDPNEDKVDKVLANLLGRGISQAIPGVGAFLPKTKVGEEVAGMATETALDPLNALGAPAAAGGKALKSLSKGLGNVPEVMEAISKQYGEEGVKVLQKALEEGQNLDELFGVPQQKGNPVNVLADPQVQLPEIPRSGINLPPQAPKELTDLAPVAESQRPSYLDDAWFDFAQRGNGPAARRMGPIDPIEEALKSKPTGYFKNLYEQVAKGDGSVFADEVSDLQRQADEIQQAMMGERERMVGQYLSDRKANNALWGEKDLAPDEARELMKQAEAIEMDNLQKSVNPDVVKADAEWKATQEIAQRDKHFKEKYGKIIVPEDNWADWGQLVPPRYRANRGETKGMDLYAVADAEGVSPDELVDILRNTADATKTRKKDLMPNVSDEVEEVSLEEILNESAKGMADFSTRHLDELVKKEEVLKQPANNLDDILNRLQNPKAPDLTPQWKQEAEDAFLNSDFFKSQNQVLEAIEADIKARSNPTKEMIYKKLKGEKDPSDFNMLVDLYLKDMERYNNNPADLKQMLKGDDRINEAIKGLFPPSRAAAEVAPAVEEASGPAFKLDELLSSLAPQARKTPDEILREMAGKADASTPSVAPNPEPTNGVRMNLQAFQDNPADNPIVQAGEAKETVTAIDSIDNPVKKKVAKFVESYLNRNHSAKVTETRILENEIKRVKEAGGDSSILEAQLKNVKKYGSDFEKALTNEAAADAMTKTQLDKHFGNMMKSVKNSDKELAKGMEWVIAKRLLYKKQANPEYKLPQGWTWERLMSVEAGGNGKYDELLSSVQGWKQEQLDTRLQYGLINKQQYDDLMKDPYYIPLQRDQTHLMNNVEVGYNRGSHSNRRGMDELVDEWGSGDINSFFKNPLEAMVNTTYAVNKNALKNDTAQQMLRLADMDADNMFIQKISKKDFQKHGGVEVYVDGEVQYVQPHKDLLDLMKENDAGLSMDLAQKLTGWMARLKTSSLEYQTGAVMRDITESFIKSQAGPLRWFQHAYNAVKNQNADAKEVGAYFQHAHTDNLGGLDPKAMTEQFKKNNSNVKIVKFNKEGFKEMGRVLEKVYDFATTPARAIGQYSDNLPREIEVLEATRRFNQSKGLDGTTNTQQLNYIDDEIRQIDERLSAAQGNSDAFSSDLAGIDTLSARKQELEQQKLALGRDLKREQIYQGRDIMNYSRAGRGKASQAIRKYVMFANTATQSKDKLVRSFIQHPGQTLVKAGIAVAPMVAAQQIAHNMMSESDKEIFDNLPSYMTDMNYVFVQDGEVTVLPKAHELALITNPIEDMMTGQPIEDSIRMMTRELLPYQAGTALQGLVPNEDGSVTYRDNTQLPGTLGTPVIDIGANKKMGFNQKTISWGAMKKDPEDQTSSDYTYDMFKDLLGDNPRADFAQYATQQYGGDPAKYGMALAEFLNDRGNQEKLDNLILNLNPLQDRRYSDEYRYFKNVPSK